MISKRKVNGKTQTIPMGIGLGLLMSLIVTLVGAAISAYLIITEKIGETSIGYGSMVILVAAAALGSWVATSSIGRRRLMVCGIFSAAYYMLLLGTTAMFFGGQYEGMGITAIMILIGSGIVLLLGVLQKRGGGSKHKIPVYR